MAEQDDGPQTSAAFAAAAEAMAAARAITVLTGAGISTESGIPDFRGPQGLWTRDPGAERRATIQAYLEDPEVRRGAWQRRLDRSEADPGPNPGHYALTELDRSGRLHTLVTQNVDGLHHAAGTSPERIVEIHGNVREVACLACRARGPIAPVLERVRGGEEDPACQDCGGLLKTATISFGQALVPEDLERSSSAAAACDLFLTVGTSLTVYPVAGLPEVALEHGARLVILNAEETPYDARAHAVLRGQIGAVLPALVQQAGAAQRP